MVNTTAAYVVIIFLHRDHRWPVIQAHSSQPEVGIVGYFASLLDEFIKSGGRNPIDTSDKAPTPQTIFTGRGTIALNTMLDITNDSS